MAARIYRLTTAGRDAWEREDPAVPADYRRILWMMDLHGSAAESLAKVFPVDLLEEWLSELEEIGLIETVAAGEAREDDFAARGSDATHTLDRRDLRAAAKEAGAELVRCGAYLAADRLRRRPASVKPAGETVVLIVEDDPDQLALADLRVSMAGYKVRVAGSVNAFLQAIVDEGAPDLLLLDIMLPDGDGFDVLARMRRHPALGSLPIIMLTTRNEAGDIGRGLVLGADGYVTKPYTKNLLADVIRRALKHD
jgi:CheY-like chemotaxis protein